MLKKNVVVGRSQSAASSFSSAEHCIQSLVHLPLTAPRPSCSIGFQALCQPTLFAMSFGNVLGIWHVMAQSGFLQWIRWIPTEFVSPWRASESCGSDAGLQQINTGSRYPSWSAKTNEDLDIFHIRSIQLSYSSVGFILYFHSFELAGFVSQWFPLVWGLLRGAHSR